MPDYTYLKMKIQREMQQEENSENKKHIEFVNTFLRHRDALIKLLVKDCKESIERDVTNIYTIGVREYIKKHSYNKYYPSWGGLKKSFLDPNYELYGRVCHTAQVKGKWRCVAISPVALPYLHDGLGNLEEEIISTHSNHDEDEFFCNWYFPTEQCFDEFIDDVNAILIKDEIRIYRYKDSEYLHFKANLGAL